MNLREVKFVCQDIHDIDINSVSLVESIFLSFKFDKATVISHDN